MLWFSEDQRSVRILTKNQIYTVTTSVQTVK